MKLKIFIAIGVLIIPLSAFSQITYINPQINLTGYNSITLVPKTDTFYRKHGMPDYDFGFGLSNTFSTQSPFYLEIGTNYKTYGDRCCKKLEPVTKGYGVGRYTIIDASIEPKYYFKHKLFVSLLVKVNWIINVKSFQNNSDFLIPFEKSLIDVWKRKDMSNEVHTLTFASTGLAIGKEFKSKKNQVIIMNIYAESPFKSIIRPAHLDDDGYRIPRNIGISFGYGFRDKKYYHKPIAS